VPFTLAHPAAILPLRHIKPLRTVPLILGALAPDVRLYLPWDVRSVIPNTHTLRGSVMVCVPLCLGVLAALYLLRAPLTALLSPRARWLYLTAIEPFGRSVWEWLFAPLSILVGIASHLLWDSFTHGDGWMVRHYPLLRDQLWIAGNYTSVDRILQYLSSVLGLAVLAVWYWRLPAAPPARAVHSTRPPAGPVLVLCVAAATLIGAVQATVAMERLPSYYHTVEVFLSHALSWFAALYLFAGTVLTLEHRHGDAGDAR
jgi:hypothetical protein